jgi:hypothetical protein
MINCTRPGEIDKVQMKLMTNEPYHIDESRFMKSTTKGKLHMYEVKLHE